MQDFRIRLRSVQEVQEFVSLATSRPFPVLVCDQRHTVDAKCFMEMFTLDFTQPLFLNAECGEEEYRQLCQDARHFAAI